MPSLEWCHVCRKCLNDFSSHNNICISSRNRRESIEAILGVGHHSYSLLEGDLSFQFCGLGNKAGETRRQVQVSYKESSVGPPLKLMIFFKYAIFFSLSPESEGEVRDAICLGSTSAFTPSLFACGRVLVLPVLHHLQKPMPAKFTSWSWLKKMGHLDSA